MGTRYTYIGPHKFPMPEVEPAAPAPEPKKRGKKAKQVELPPATMEETPVEPFSDEPA